MRSRAFADFSANTQAIIDEVLGDSAHDELNALQGAAALSLVLISEWQAQVRQLEKKARKTADKAGLDGGGVLTAVIIVHEHSKGERAGKPENLRTTKTEKQLVRYVDAIGKLQERISRENSNYAKIQEKISKAKHLRANSADSFTNDGPDMVAELFKSAGVSADLLSNK